MPIFGMIKQRFLANVVQHGVFNMVLSTCCVQHGVFSMVLSTCCVQHGVFSMVCSQRHFVDVIVFYIVFADKQAEQAKNAFNACFST